jgi:hypothetical protein
VLAQRAVPDAFAAAIAATSAGGEVIVLDSAGYGPVTITQAVSIIAPQGIYAGISAFSGNGITVNAPGAIVVLRGLSINGQGGFDGMFTHNNGNGVNAYTISGSTTVITVERAVPSNNVASGLRVNAGPASAVATISRNTINYDGSDGISVSGPLANVSAFENAIQRNSGTGVFLGG